jgi:Tfp pilus assembly protein FimV
LHPNGRSWECLFVARTFAFPGFTVTPPGDDQAMAALTYPARSTASRSLRPIRLPAVTYRRRRLAALGALLVALAVAAALLLAALAPAVEAPHPVAAVTYVVQPGDTLWSIAAAVAPGADLRAVVDAIADANSGSSLVPGQRLVLDLP